MILVVGELFFNPLVDLTEGEVAVLLAANGHLDQVHVAVWGPLAAATFSTNLKYKM